METVGSEGAIVMPSFLLSPFLPLTERDIDMGLTMKIRLLSPDADEKSGMGVIADTFRKMPGVVTGEGTFRVSAWGKDAEIHSRGFHRIIDGGGYALMLGVDIYRLSSMHYMEDLLPDEVKNIFRTSEEAQKLYPEDKWMIEGGVPPVKAWYKIQDEAYRRGYITDSVIGQANCMFFRVSDVVELYRKALETDPLGLYGL